LFVLHTPSPVVLSAGRDAWPTRHRPYWLSSTADKCQQENTRVR